MATAEAKPKAMEEENPLPPNSMIWVLRVSIHCEGCKKKVIKILNKIQGVYRADVDIKQHKVTVVGNVEVETVIRSLEKKTGRRVELWPQPERPAPREKKQSRSMNREELPKLQQDEQTKEAPDNEDKKLKATGEEKNELGPPTESEISSKKCENGGGSKDGGETSDNVVKVKERAESEAKTMPVADKAAPASGVEKGESGGGGEKEMKGQNGNNTNGDSVEDGDRERAKGNSRSGLHPPSRASMNPGPDPGSSLVRIHNEYPSLFPNLNAPPPVYTVSYHASYPTARSYGGASFYDPPPSGSSYVYMNPRQELDAPAYNTCPNIDESSNVFDRFSDENPNACSIM